MSCTRLSWTAFLLHGFVLLPPHLFAQGTLADYGRANSLLRIIRNLGDNIPEKATWIEGTNRFCYRKSVKGGHEFVLCEASTVAKKPAFDHARLAAALSKSTGEKYTALELPFTTVTFVDKERAIEFTAAQQEWKCDVAKYECQKKPLREMPDRPSTSPDGKWQAIIRNRNIFLRAAGKTATTPLSFDGSEGNAYVAPSIRWSPDSKKIAAFRVRPGFHRKIQFIESSPSDQVQPKYSTFEYPKPGDAVDIQQPALFDIASKKQITVENSLFPNPYRLSPIVWRKDSRSFTFEYNQRGHQVYRIVEVDGETGHARALVDEESRTFFCYFSKMYRYDTALGKEIVWMSERDGWNHLYLYDGIKGTVKNQITKGNWVVRAVEKVDEEKRRIWFSASGMYPGKDPYFNHYYRINFDGSGLTAITETDADHGVSFSPDMKYYTDTWSRVDLAPVSELRTTADRKLVSEFERADIQVLRKAGIQSPESFVAPGRDGKTEIWGIITRPTNFDAAKKYPVIEYIYAGPHSSFVPKSFSVNYPMQSLAELGFIVVQIDGMGTSNRSKAFHDVAWRNLADAGFPDRILWHRAVAAKYPYYDIGRVGIYGVSAGAQNALGALLFHPEFYKAAVASCGCHDNRMDKMSWNEQWMGWPLGPEYAACSNVDNAYRLKGKLLLTVGEMDKNVDPASTMQVVNALIKANKVFDLVVFPGQGHGNGGEYGIRKRNDFFVHHLLGVEPPDWN